MRSKRKNARRGNVLVLTAILMIAVVAMAAFAVDVGCLQVAKTQMQASADASALAGGWALIPTSPDDNWSTLQNRATQQAVQFAALNKVLSESPAIDALGDGATGEIVFGYLANLSDPNCPMTFDDASRFNALQITVNRTASRNGEIPLPFGRVLGTGKTSLSARATAALVNSVGGLAAPSNGTNLELMPFALDRDTWEYVKNGGGSDQYKFDPETGEVRPGSDGIPEANLFPQGTGSPGNRGTVDIGPANNSTNDIARQIVHGVNQQDLSYVGGELKFNSQGKLFLNGDTGISAGVKDELASIIGKPRIIPIFSEVGGNGNNATYTIVKFVGVRIMAVKLTGSMKSKYVMIQPAVIVAGGVIPGSSPTTSDFVYSPVRLVR